MMVNCPKCKTRLFIRYYPEHTENIWATCPECRYGWVQKIIGGVVAAHDPYRMKKAEKFLRAKIKKTKSVVCREQSVFDIMLPDIRCREYLESGHVLNQQAKEVHENFTTRKNRI